MKLYKTTMTPLGTFGTPLKGDTLFGQLCWAIRYAYGEEKLISLLETYDEHPFLIVSDGFARGYLPKPAMPSSLLGENPDEKKLNRKKKWLTLENLQSGSYAKALNDDEAGYMEKTASVVKNALSYETFSTKAEGFDPYSEEEIALSQRDIYFLTDESQWDIAMLEGALQMLSDMGYGKNASTGKGRFVFEPFEEVIFGKESSQAYMTLSPVAMEGLGAKKVYYDTFVRFGKHGAQRATKHVFKKPLLLADTAAVIVLEEPKAAPYMGRSVRNHSKYEDTVHQGYAITVPIKEIR